MSCKCPVCNYEIEFQPALTGRKLMCECEAKFRLLPKFPEKIKMSSEYGMIEISGEKIPALVAEKKLDPNAKILALPGEREFFSYYSAIDKLGYVSKIISVPASATVPAAGVVAAAGASVVPAVQNTGSNLPAICAAPGGIAATEQSSGSKQRNAADDFFNSSMPAGTSSGVPFGSAWFSLILGVIALGILGTGACMTIAREGVSLWENEKSTFQNILGLVCGISLLGSYVWMIFSLFVLDPIRNSKSTNGLNLRVISEVKKIILASILVCVFALSYLNHLFWDNTVISYIPILIPLLWLFMCFLAPEELREKTGLKKLFRFIGKAFKLIFGKILGKGMLSALGAGLEESSKTYVEVTHYSDGSTTKEKKHGDGCGVFLIFTAIIVIVAIYAVYLALIVLALYAFFCFCRNYIFYR